MKHLITLILLSLGAFNISYSGKQQSFYFDIEKPHTLMFCGIRKVGIHDDVKSNRYVLRRDVETFYKLCKTSDIRYVSNLAIKKLKQRGVSTLK